MSQARYGVGSNQYQKRERSAIDTESSLDLGHDDIADGDQSPTIGPVHPFADPDSSHEVRRLHCATDGSTEGARSVRHDPSPTVRAFAALALGETQELDSQARTLSRLLFAS